jgi:hypothetical protein
MVATMASRLNFTTRDWLWFCVVMALAFGWSGHFRYSKWIEDHLVNNPEKAYLYDENELIELKNARERTFSLEVENDALKRECSALMYCINMICTEAQRTEVSKTKLDYLEKPRRTLSL